MVKVPAGGAKLVGRIALEIYRRPFLLRPTLWWLLSGLFLATAVSLGVVGIPPIRGVVPAAAMAAALAFMGWTCYRWRNSPAPLVVVATFHSASKAGSALAPTHSSALIRSLRESFGSRLTVRAVHVPITEMEARQVQQNLSALLVVHGNLDTAGSHARFETRLTFGDSPLDYSLARHRLSLVYDETKLSRRERKRLDKFVPQQHVEGSVPVEALVATSVETESFEVVGIATALLLEEQRVNAATQEQPIVVMLPPAHQALPDEIAARVQQLEALARSASGEDPRQVMDAVLGEAERGYGGEGIWIWLEAQAFVGLQEGWCDIAHTTRINERAMELFPDSWTLAYNAAETRIEAGDPRGALEAADMAEALGAPEALMLYLRGAIKYHERSIAEALAIYRRAPLDSRREHYIGDCLVWLGRPDEALDAYRRAIARDPFRRRAILGARKLAVPTIYALVAFEGVWRRLCGKGFGRILRTLADRRLRRLLRTQGELLGIHEAIAWVALLRRDFLRADMFAEYAATEGGRSNIRAITTLAITADVMRRPQSAAHALEGLRAHMDWLTGTGHPAPKEELKVALSCLARVRPELTGGVYESLVHLAH